MGDEVELSEKIGIQSVETGIKLLMALTDLCLVGPPPMLKTLAEAANMPPAKAHRYLVSFIRTQMVERDQTTGRYRPGANARNLGLSAVRGLDVVRVVTAKMPKISLEIQQSICLAIWAHHGPVIVSVEDASIHPVLISTRVGEVLPLTISATGHVFGAWLPTKITTPIVKKELIANKNKGHTPSTMQEAKNIFDRTRNQGVSSVTGGLSQVINALSVPLFDFGGNLVGALSSLGQASRFDASPTGPLACKLKEAGKAISRELGYSEAQS